MNKRLIATVLPLMLLALLACVNTTPLPPGTPSPLSDYDQEAAYVAAQATLAAGQSEIMALSHQATVVSLNRDQAADVAAQATIDHNQRQLMELSIRATEVSLNMAQAAATQRFIIEQTRTAQNAEATARSQAATATAQSRAVAATAESHAATATYAAYALNVTQTAQAQAIRDVHAAGTAQAQATLTAYPLTATPEAAIEAYIVRDREQRERRAWWEEFVVTPVRAILSTLIIVLLIAGGVIAFRRLLPALEFRLRNPRGNDNRNPQSLTDGTIVNLDALDRRLEQQDPHLRHRPQLVGDETQQIEIVDPSEPSIVDWIAEAERKLRTEEETQP
jgi:hypothetical protein